MNAREFFYTVARMRRAQRDYFKTRHPQDLRRARALEQTVDAVVNDVMARDKAPEPTCQSYNGGTLEIY